MPQSFPYSQAQVNAAPQKSMAGRRYNGPALLRFWHLASMDAPSVAVVWALAFAWAAQISLPLWIPVLLALVTWAVYVVDRLLDARRGLRSPRLHRLRERHRFHWRYRRLLLPLALAAASGAACLVFRLMTRSAVEGNLALASVTLAYFTSVHSPREIGGRAFALRSPFRLPFFPVELFIAIVFTAGCVLPVFCRMPAQWDAALLPPLGAAIFFVLLTWLNAYAIRCWESGGQQAPSRVFVGGCVLGGLGLAAACGLSSDHARVALLLASGSTSALLLAFLDRIRRRLTPLALRACADLVLLTPLALLWR